MNNDRRIRIFEEAPIYRAIMTLCIPTICSSLVMVLYNLVDTYFVGMLNDPIQNSGVTLAAPVLLAFNAVNNLFGVGSSSMMSRALGRKDLETVRMSSAFGFYSALIAAVLFSLSCSIFEAPLLKLLGADAETVGATAGYLKWTVICGAAPAIINVVMAYLVRAEGAALHASIGTMSGCILNIILDPVFILPRGFGMGAAGAGLATFISNCVASLYFFILIFARRRSTYVCLHPAAYRPTRYIVLGVCGVGIPAAIQNLLNVTGMTVLNNFAAGYGPDAVAAMGITQKINQVPMYVALGMGQGLTPFISYNFGSGNIKRLKESLFTCLRIAVTFMVIVCLGYQIFATHLTGLFMKNETVVYYGARLLRGMSLAMPFMCVDFITVGVFQACGKGRNALIFAIMRKIVLEIPALVIWNHILPLFGLAFAQPTAEIVLAVVSAVVLTRMLRDMSMSASGSGSR